MTVAEAIELVLELAEVQAGRKSEALKDREQDAIGIVRDIVLTHYKPDDHTGG